MKIDGKLDFLFFFNTSRNHNRNVLLEKNFSIERMYYLIFSFFLLYLIKRIFVTNNSVWINMFELIFILEEMKL